MLLQSECYFPKKNKYLTAILQWYYFSAQYLDGKIRHSLILWGFFSASKNTLVIESVPAHSETVKLQLEAILSLSNIWKGVSSVGIEGIRNGIGCTTTLGCSCLRENHFRTKITLTSSLVLSQSEPKHRLCRQWEWKVITHRLRLFSVGNI